MQIHTLPILTIYQPGNKPAIVAGVNYHEFHTDNFPYVNKVVMCHSIVDEANYTLQDGDILTYVISEGIVTIFEYKNSELQKVIGLHDHYDWETEIEGLMHSRIKILIYLNSYFITIDNNIFASCKPAKLHLFNGSEELLDNAHLTTLYNTDNITACIVYLLLQTNLKFEYINNDFICNHVHESNPSLTWKIFVVHDMFYKDYYMWDFSVTTYFNNNIIPVWANKILL